MPQKPIRRDLKYYWRSIKNKIESGNEQEALTIFLFVLNQYRSNGVEAGMKKVELRQSSMIHRITDYIRSELGEATREGRDQKITYDPVVMRQKAQYLKKEPKKPNFLTDTMGLIQTATGFKSASPFSADSLERSEQ